MTETPNSPTGPRKLLSGTGEPIASRPQLLSGTGTPISPRPSLLTPGLQQEETPATVAPSDSAPAQINPELVDSSLSTEEVSVEQYPDTIAQTEPVAPEPQPVTPSTIHEETTVTNPAPFSEAPPVEQAPTIDALDPKVSDALNKIKEAQEELKRAQEQALVFLQQEEARIQSQTLAATAEPIQQITQPSPTPVLLTQQVIQTESAPALQTQQPTSLPPAPALSIQPDIQTPLQGSSTVLNTSPVIAPVGSTPTPGSAGYGSVPNPPEQKAFKSKKMIYITLAISCLIIGFGGYKYMDYSRKQEINDKITRYGQIGGQLGSRAEELGLKDEQFKIVFKYSPTTYPGIEIPNSKKDVQLLLDHIRKEQNKSSWQGILHVLCIMALQDPAVADMLFDDVASNYKSYAGVKLNQMAMIISAQKNERLMNKLLQTAEAIGKKQDISRQAEIISGARYGYNPSKLPDLAEQYINQDTAKPLRDAIRPAFEILIPQATEPQKEAAADKIINNLDSVEAKNRYDYLEVLARIGTPNALSFLLGKISNDDFENKPVLRALSVWSNDSIIQPLIDILDSDKFSDEKVIAPVRSLALHQMAYNTRQRSDEEGEKMFRYFINDAEKEKDADLQTRKKKSIIHSLGNLYPQPHVNKLLEEYAKDSNNEVAKMAKKAAADVKTRGDKRDAPVKTKSEKRDEVNAAIMEALK